MKSEVAGEQATSEHRILPRGAYQISRKNKYRPLRASEHEREREIRDTTSCVVGRSEWSYYGKDDDHEVNHESTDEEYSSDNEYESVPCTDAGRQFPNRPYYKRVRKRAHSPSAVVIRSEANQSESVGISRPPTDSQPHPSNMRINMHKMAEAQR